MRDFLGKLIDHWRKGDLASTVEKRVRWWFRPASQRYLERATGVVHVGANTGQGCEVYARYGLPVVWIEPIPDVFDKLLDNIAPYHDQRAVCALLTDCDDQQHEFHVASNGGGSSSVFEFKMHNDIWPNVRFVQSIALKSTTLATLMRRENIDPRRHDLLVMDTQGSELLILKGAGDQLANFRQVLTEAADFEAYAGGCQLHELAEWLSRFGFRETWRKAFAEHPGGGKYYNVMFQRD